MEVRTGLRYQFTFVMDVDEDALDNAGIAEHLSGREASITRAIATREFIKARLDECGLYLIDLTCSGATVHDPTKEATDNLLAIMQELDT